MGPEWSDNNWFLTKGEWVVDEIVGYSGDQLTIHFTGFVDTPLERQLYSIRMPWRQPEIDEFKF